MGDVLQIQIGSAKNVNSVNVDQNLNIGLESSVKELLSYNESSVIDVSRLFEAERQESKVYRVYGRIDFMSIINGLSKQYTKLTDFFRPVRLGDELSGLTKNIVNSFDVYLCYPSNDKTYLSPETYVRNYVVVSKLDNFEIYKAGFSRNIFANYIYAFNFNVDFNVEGYLDAFGKPITRFYMYFKYKTGQNGASVAETITSGYTSVSTTLLSSTPITIGTVIKGDIVNYVNTNYEETLEADGKVQYFVTFPYDVNSFKFKYNPFIEIKVRDFDDQIVSANISGGTESDLTIPYYAIKIDDDGNYIWKQLLINGYIDPINGNGVDYPFLNKRHYIFNRIVLSMKPDMSHANTANVFSEIEFANNLNLFNRPSSDLNALGNKCA
jgi:hypothetical protein